MSDNTGDMSANERTPPPPAAATATFRVGAPRATDVDIAAALRHIADALESGRVGSVEVSVRPHTWGEVEYEVRAVVWEKP